MREPTSFILTLLHGNRFTYVAFGIFRAQYWCLSIIIYDVILLHKSAVISDFLADIDSVRQK
jgi:hypothetical protein